MTGSKQGEVKLSWRTAQKIVNCFGPNSNLRETTEANDLIEMFQSMDYMSIGNYDRAVDQLIRDLYKEELEKWSHQLEQYGHTDGGTDQVVKRLQQQTAEMLTRIRQKIQEEFGLDLQTDPPLLNEVQRIQLDDQVELGDDGLGAYSADEREV